MIWNRTLLCERSHPTLRQPNARGRGLSLQVQTELIARVVRRCPTIHLYYTTSNATLIATLPLARTTGFRETTSNFLMIRTKRLPLARKIADIVLPSPAAGFVAPERLSESASDDLSTARFFPNERQLAIVNWRVFSFAGAARRLFLTLPNAELWVLRRAGETVAIAAVLLNDQSRTLLSVSVSPALDLSLSEQVRWIDRRAWRAVFWPQ